MDKHYCCNLCKALQRNMRCKLGYNNVKIPKGITPLQFKFQGLALYGYPQEPCPKPLTDEELKELEKLQGESK